MKLVDYQAMVRRCVVYPAEAAFSYPILGLAGESGEALEKIFTSDGNAKVKADEETIKELGDVLWYTTAAAMDAGFNLTDLSVFICGTVMESFQELEWWLLTTSDNRSPYMRLMMNVGRAAEIAKKAIRDNRGRIQEAKRSDVGVALSNVLHSLALICWRLGITLDNVAQTNHDKLTSRKDRGKLKGDGDNR